MIRRFWKILTGEWKTILHDDGVFLVLVGATVIYSALYGFIYAPQVVRDMPVAVVDCDMSAESQALTMAVNATPAARVVAHCTTLEEAKEMFLSRKVVGVMLINKGYESQISTGIPAHVSVYADGSYFLLYSGFLSAVSDVVIERGAQIEIDNLTASGLDEHRAQGIAQPVKYKVDRLYNPYNGYASALLPSVLLVILQQVLLIGIGMGMGTDSEFRRWGRYCGSSTLTVTMGKALAYFLFFIPLCFYLFWADYRFFGYPINGNEMEVILFLLPYLLSIIFLGITFGSLLHRRESAILYLAVFSVFLIMVSGISWPKEGMPSWMYYGAQVLPSSSAINGFMRLRAAGAELSSVLVEWITLWILTFIYATTAVIAVARARRR